ncbi:MAG TPA: MMPL family transporter [Methanocorpusculum sp.]|nr:MMPL family transporter [Methanocorpusculum sp.]
MKSYSDFVIDHRVPIIIIMFILAAVCGVLMTQVEVNYNMVDYLPEDSPSTIALHTMEDQYEGGVPNARVMVENITIPEALELKEKLKAIDGVTEVQWLDDSVSTDIPLEYLGTDVTENYYRDGTALFTLTIDEANGRETVKEIRAVVGDDAKMSGQMVSQAFSGDNMTKDLKKILFIAFPIILIILLFTTTSWFEPVLFLVVIGVAILINMGTNIIFGEISSTTKGIAALLQLAISIDYAIFLLHRFDEYIRQKMPAKEAMKMAMKKAALSIWTSGITAAIGFAGLCVMRFKIGPDIGFVMVKAIFVSLICVFTLLPAITICCHKMLVRTHHRSLMPTFKRFARLVRKYCVPFLIIMLIIFVPCVLAVFANDYIYMDMYNDPNTVIGQDEQAIKDKFGESTSLVLMVPVGSPEKEIAVQEEIEAMPIVKTLLSYSKSVGESIPPEYVPSDTLEKLVSAEYTRFVISIDAKMECSESFAAVEELRRIGDSYYPGAYHLVGEAANAYDMKDVVEDDDVLVNLIAVGGIFVVLMLIFRSLLIPAVLVFVIDAMIWINCSVPYFTGVSMFYIVRLIIFALQLAATVDYGILFASRYFEYRREMKRREALEMTISTSFVSILTSAVILFVCALLLALISSDALLASVGILVARGSVLAIISVMFVLPAMLMILDKPIQKLSLKMKFVPDDAKGVKNL